MLIELNEGIMQSLTKTEREIIKFIKKELTRRFQPFCVNSFYLNYCDFISVHASSYFFNTSAGKFKNTSDLSKIFLSG